MEEVEALLQFLCDVMLRRCNPLIVVKLFFSGGRYNTFCFFRESTFFHFFEPNLSNCL